MNYVINKIDDEYILTESDREGGYSTMEEGLEAIEVVKNAMRVTAKDVILKDSSQGHVRADRKKDNRRITRDLKGGR